MSWWQVRSNNPAVTSVAVNVLAFYEGTLYTGDFAGVTQAGRLYAIVDTRLAAETAAGTLYEFALSATLDDVGGLSASPAWAGSWTSQTVGFEFSKKQFGVQYTLSISSPDAELTLLTLPAPVPEPGQFAMLAAGMGCLFARRALTRRP